MSYDLFFTHPDITWDEFESYFKNKQFYILGDSRAVYHNDATGVNFSFHHQDESDEIQGNVAFNMKYARPHFSGSEAADEVEKFISRFKCSIEDPQVSGMGNGLFTTECFLKGWNAGNKLSDKVINRLNGDDKSAALSTHSMSTEKFKQISEWNSSIGDVLRTLTDNLFIPDIFFVKADGVLTACAVWPDAIPTIVPDVDALIIQRKDCAPKNAATVGLENMCFLRRDEFPDFFSKYLTKGYAIDAFQLPSPKTPKYIKDYVRGLPIYEGELEQVEIGKVIK